MLHSSTGEKDSLTWHRSKMAGAAQDPDTPVRSFMEGDHIQWREGRPDYDLINRKFLAERSCRHPPGSLERTVENLVKTWEMEILHKTNKKDIQTTDDHFRGKINGGRWFTLDDIIKRGTYNLFLEESDHYDSEKETVQSSNELFKCAFDQGFPWEVIEVYSGPPKISFKWRHWTHWTGPYKGHQPTGELIELFGVMVGVVQDGKVVEGEIYYDANPMMKTLLGGKGCPLSEK